MLCYCCYKDKDRKEFGTHRVSKSLPQFCIECYHAYTLKERKEKQRCGNDEKCTESKDF